MQELGELQRQHERLAQCSVRIVAVSVDSPAETQAMQRRFPNLILLSDDSRQLIAAFQALHAKQGPGGADAAAPTTFLVDRGGVIRHVYRPARIIERLDVEDLWQAVQTHLPAATPP